MQEYTKYTQVLDAMTVAKRRLEEARVLMQDLDSAMGHEMVQVQFALELQWCIWQKKYKKELRKPIELIPWERGVLKKNTTKYKGRF